MGIPGERWSKSSVPSHTIFYLPYFSLSLKEYLGKKIKIGSENGTKVIVCAEDGPIIL